MEDYKDQCTAVHNLLHTSKSTYYNQQIMDNSNNPKVVFNIVNELTHNTSQNVLPPHQSADILANDFADFFVEKVEKIHANLASGQHPSDDSFLPLVDIIQIISEFNPATEEEIRKIIMESPTKSSQLDPIPTWLLKSCVDELLPIITTVVNLSLTNGDMPKNLKEAIILPLLKKLLLDPEVFKNFLPVSNLKFLSKIIEKVVAFRFKAHIAINNLGEPFQSAYKALHSTETALVRVSNDILMSLDQHKAVALVLLDLSAAFDTVDHGLLIRLLNQRLGITGTALRWFSSYLSDRSQCVSINGVKSASHPLTCGVPQGSVLGPLLFSVYTLPLGDIMRKHDIDFHFFADDSQLYICFHPRKEGS